MGGPERVGSRRSHTAPPRTDAPARAEGARRTERARTREAERPRVSDGFEAHRRREAAHLARPYASDRTAARAVADREASAHPPRTYDLNSRTDVGILISRSPQLDDNDDTMRDRDRCGGAAVVNAMLLSGNPAANSDALRATAGRDLVAATPGADDALTHMRAGRMSARDAGVLQELAYEAARQRNPTESRPDVGVSRTEPAPLMRDLSREGAFNGSSVELENHRLPDGGTHWTTSVDGPNGPGRADSWPRTDGYATVVGGSTELAVPGATARDSHVSLSRDGTVSDGPG